jgi:hypothetical protein
VSEPIRTFDFADGTNGALVVVGGGTLVFVLGWIRGSRLLRLLGLGGILAGAGVFARGKLAERSRKISAAESNIRSELDELDPVARAQVLADLARGKA